MNTTIQPEHRLKVALFSGGRGTGSITDALLKYDNIELTLLVNTYDDGLSTGLLRRFIPGMLGPSDVRKNISRFLHHRPDHQSQALLVMMEYRFPDPMETQKALDTLRVLTDSENPGPIDPELLKARENLSVSQLRTVASYLKAFLDYYEASEKPSWFVFPDVSLGNILFAGCYLKNGQNFNKTVTEFSALAEIGNAVLNITNGENRVLVAVKENGMFLHDEAHVVGPQDSSRIEEIFLLRDYLGTDSKMEDRSKAEKVEFLRDQENLPTLNPAADQALRQADIIIYGPGTQYSSLFPSYLTIGVAEAIAANVDAEKIFIANIAKDYDILGEDATTLVKAFLSTMSRKSAVKINPPELVSRFFFQKPEPDKQGATPYMPFYADEFGYPLEKVMWLDWEGDAGKHSGSRTVSELLLVVEEHIKKRVQHMSHKVSIIVPVLNEERTITHVLRDLHNLQFPGVTLEKEVIVVDSGSTDRSFELAGQEKSVRLYRLQHSYGRGAALRMGLARAKGDIAVFFPADDEYRVDDIVRVVMPLIRQEFPVVFGSRAFNSTDLTGTLKRVYGRKGFLYSASKYGGIMLSILTLVIYNRFISDPLTSIKGFNTRIFRDMKFTCKGFDFDIELIAKIARAGHVILEVPVSYRARTVQEGKKITVWDGITCLVTLFQFSRWKAPYAKSVDRHSSV